MKIFSGKQDYSVMQTLIGLFILFFLALSKCDDIICFFLFFLIMSYQKAVLVDFLPLVVSRMKLLFQLLDLFVLFQQLACNVTAV